MSIKHLIYICVCFIFAFNSAYAQYNAAGSDFSKAKSETWTQDNAADSLKMINAFVCIAGHSGGNNRPNGTWRALIDELKCGLKQADEGDSGALSLADVTMVSTRASDTSDQEITAYFASTSGSNYITDMTMNVNGSSAFGMTMDFRWYQSPDNTTAVNQSTMSNGFSDISVADNNSDGNMDTIILHTEYSPAGGGDPLFRSGAFAVTYGPNNNVTAYVGSNLDQEDGSKVYYKGITSETEYKREKYNAAQALQVTRCYDRTKEWSNVYDYGLYDNATGAEVDISGSFGFNYSSSSKRGYMGHWGVWMSGGYSDYPSGASSVAIVQEDTETNMTLHAAPGKLTKLTKSTHTFKDGEQFRVWKGNGDQDVFFRTGCGTSNFSTASGSCSEFTTHANHWRGAGQTIQQGDFMWSELAKAEIIVQSATQALMFKRTPIIASTTSPDITSDLALTCSGYCPKGKPTKTNIEQRTHTGNCDAAGGAGKNGPGASGCTYTFKKLSDSTSPMTLFKGADPVVPYKNDLSAPMTEADAQQGYYYGMNDGKYILTSDIGGTCAASVTHSTNNVWNCTNGVFQYETGINSWNNRYYAKYADNSSVVEIEQPISLSYTFATSDDLNTDFTQAAPFEFTWKKELYGTGGYDNITGTTTYPAAFNGSSFILEYEGKGQLWGFPEKRTENSWLRLINPRDGTQFVNADNSSQGYVVKALGIGKMFSEKAGGCGSLSVPAAFTFASILTETDRSSSTAVWGGRPNVATISVNHGVEIE